jgi:molecular chaperone GrpE
MGRDNGDQELPGRGNGARAANDQVPDTAPAASAPGEEPAAPAEAAVLDPLAEAQTRVETLEKDKLELRDRMLRVAADFDNFKKRNRKEMAESESRGRESLLKELLSVIDNLERALAHATAADVAGGETGLLEGVRMVHRQFLAALEKFEVLPFSAVGEAFDPQFHAAVQQVPTADKPAGMVVEEFQRGYRMGKRLLRPAMVAVATPPRAPAASEDQDSGAAGDSGGEQAGGGTPPPSAG